MKLHCMQSLALIPLYKLVDGIPYLILYPATNAINYLFLTFELCDKSIYRRGLVKEPLSQKPYWPCYTLKKESEQK